MDVRTVDWLAGPEGAALLATLPPYDESRALAVGEQLRRAGTDPAVVAAALTQSRLRARGVAKLGPEAATMLLTPDGLEQASRAAVATLHAARFASAGVRHVFDLGCGIGADARALADAGLRVTAVDADPVTAAVARANLAGRPGARVVVGRAEDLVLPRPGTAREGAWLDPSRRVPGVADARGRTRRVFRLSEVSPSWEFVQGVAARLPAVGAKFGPGFPHAEVPAGAQATWLSYGGEALECTLWWGELVDRPGRGVLVHDGTRWRALAPVDSSSVPEAGGEVSPGDRVHDPDRAVLAAGLVDAVCAAVDGRECAPGSGYVVSRGGGRATPWARCLEVVEVLPMQAKALRAWVRAEDVGPLTLKKRGAWVDADALRRQLRPRGSQEATLLLTRLARPSGQDAVALWVRPCPDGSPGAR